MPRNYKHKSKIKILKMPDPIVGLATQNQMPVPWHCKRTDLYNLREADNALYQVAVEENRCWLSGMKFNPTDQIALSVSPLAALIGWSVEPFIKADCAQFITREFPCLTEAIAFRSAETDPFLPPSARAKTANLVGLAIFDFDQRRIKTVDGIFWFKIPKTVPIIWHVHGKLADAFTVQAALRNAADHFAALRNDKELSSKKLLEVLTQTKTA